ncbi:hypothetical protein RSOLAG1IB_01280 [Rhizoctonia solani AG-1 IB]|uniref:Uncharacterized protein n=1 Tax=Thanatephorus cucumeris (strain AG1-IB / isolate 7/3/14) TaxID=1108050 RepID=A0A0B7FB33_THACB|nr:hypothetical protein RSOLAG1IB_01280 [Rhizoctonia solani AG-1 IB]
MLMSTAAEVYSQNLCEYKTKGKTNSGWAKFESKGNDVCSVAFELMNGTCNLPHLPPLDKEKDKDGTSLNDNDIWYTASRFINDYQSFAIRECACDRVMFSLLSACAGCQKWKWSEVINTTSDVKWQTFEVYQDNACSDVTTKREEVPWNPSPPLWALNFHGDTFDPNVDTNIEQPPGPTSDSPTSTTNPSTEPSSTSADLAQSTGSSGPPVGAIVGGVIGGLVLLGAIAGLAYWRHCRKRRARDVAPSSEFLKPEYYATPPLLPAHERRQSTYQDDMEDEMRPSPTNRHSWGGSLVVTRRHEDEDDEDCEMLPPFTRGTYIGPSPHEKGHPERRDTDETDITMRTSNTTSFLLPSSPNRRPGPSEGYS